MIAIDIAIEGAACQKHLDETGTVLTDQGDSHDFSIMAWLFVILGEVVSCVVVSRCFRSDWALNPKVPTWARRQDSHTARSSGQVETRPTL